MTECEQTSGQNMIQHGTSVRDYLFDLIGYLQTGDSSKLQYEWKLPEKWFGLRPAGRSPDDDVNSRLPLFREAIEAVSEKTLELYTVYHDCGKPFCRTIDDDGKVHFPDHAEWSYTVFQKFFADDTAAHFILHDMDIHTLKATGEAEFAQLALAPILLLSGLAEVHSNARMFGGLESTSFKIKYKTLVARGTHILDILSRKRPSS